MMVEKLLLSVVFYRACTLERGSRVHGSLQVRRWCLLKQNLFLSADILGLTKLSSLSIFVPVFGNYSVWEIATRENGLLIFAICFCIFPSF